MDSVENKSASLLKWLGKVRNRLLELMSKLILLTH